MKGRFLRDCIRCAKRMGRRERVKFAEEYNASVERGGRPCLSSLAIEDRTERDALLD
jgi:hypothetical protein